ncbi:uncharacterized protein K452DRAFT_286873 [Aplosporella prunicola CBS 121167]|uniref:Receptor L-domain domain-containing protein n=1 Tax=Aplosporella prunicola CBS 121167 TaxID=1176127 RepID=A0A6A6BHY6_9PEZI|nr:uncharacterized protein K452DRAFT_286873 [Aplosporella prunicola CBS 121167]KAF2142457.1 hypothetical protein K452DRAFT_286873 [Aplosporella prunicola CBS 121167]
MFAKYALPVAAVAGLASAANSCSASATSTIAAANDVPTGCATFSGSLAIATDAPGTLDIQGIKKITGSLYANNVSALSSLSADSLEEIDNFELTDLEILSNLNFPKLTKVGSIKWAGLKALSELSFSSGVKEADSVDIENTFLSSLDGINLNEVGTFVVANNKYLKDVEVQFTHITERLEISENSPELKAHFPNLEWAFNMTFRNVSEVQTPSLAAMNGSLGFYGDGIKSYSAPNLTKIQEGSLSFIANPQLQNISLPKLQSVNGAFTIANNSHLAGNLSFPKLETVKGACDFSGNFSGFSLDSLKTVSGAFNMQSSEEIDTDCDHFKGLSGKDNIIRGKFECKGALTNPGGVGTKSSSTSSSSSAKSTNAAGRVEMSTTAFGAAGLLAFFFGLY